MQIVMRCRKIVGEVADAKYKNTALNLLTKINPYFGWRQNFTDLGNGSFVFNDPATFNDSVLKDLPIQPVDYDERDSYGIAKSLSSCGKVALMDTKENIVEMTSFLNDNRERKIYVSGHGDSFFPTIRGWKLRPVRNSYAEKRLKVMISSGILKHLEFLYKLWKPQKLLNHYAKWRHPKIEAVSRLDFNSKITPGFYICGILLIVCASVLFAEICSGAFSLRFSGWIRNLITNLQGKGLREFCKVSISSSR